MLFTTSLTMLAMVAHHDQTPKMEDQLSGIFSNEEHVYFEKDAGREAPPWMSFNISQQDGKWVIVHIDAFGAETGKRENVIITNGEPRDILTVGNCARNFERLAEGWTYSALQNRKLCRQDYQIISIMPEGLKLRLADGTETTLKRARSVECWAAVTKTEPKDDGSPDWKFYQKLKLHDQGGRVTVGGGDSGAEPVTLRMRAVHWPPPSNNRPSMVLYVHKADPDSAVSYSWADIDASRVGLNLRWMQASCTIAGEERSSEVSKTIFRG